MSGWQRPRAGSGRCARPPPPSWRRGSPPTRALAMPKARLIFELKPVELGPNGADQANLLFSANPGSVPGPLGKVASGGELSRVRLALEVVLAGETTGETFVFDEVDAGVGAPWHWKSGDGWPDSPKPARSSWLRILPR